MRNLLEERLTIAMQVKEIKTAIEDEESLHMTKLQERWCYVGQSLPNVYFFSNGYLPSVQFLILGRNKTR